MSPCAQVCVLEYDAPSQTVTTCAHGDVAHTSVHTESPLPPLQVCVLEYDAISKTVTTRAHGDVRDNIGAPAENGQLASLDPDGRAIAMHLYSGLIKVWG